MHATLWETYRKDNEGNLDRLGCKADCKPRMDNCVLVKNERLMKMQMFSGGEDAASASSRDGIR